MAPLVVVFSTALGCSRLLHSVVLGDCLYSAPSSVLGIDIRACNFNIDGRDERDEFNLEVRFLSRCRHVL